MIPLYDFNVLWSEEDCVFIAAVDKYPYISGFGDSPDEAIAEARIAVNLADTYVQRLEDVVGELCLLRDSGYDGPFMGEAIEPLMIALRKV